MDFDFERAFERPVRVVNDAAMQALGGYDGGRMLFLGLGTGLGSTLVADRVLVPLELGRCLGTAARRCLSGLATTHVNTEAMRRGPRMSMRSCRSCGRRCSQTT